MSRAVVHALAIGFVVAGALAAPTAAQMPQMTKSEAGYEFVAPPSIKSNRIYRVHRLTGEVGACQYETGPGIGNTKCLASGEGAGKQEPGDYGLVASHMQDEGGVFRINRRTGEMSICYVSGDRAVCTNWAR
jgi:hypothetical protein